MGKRKKVRGFKFQLKTAAWLSLAAGLILIGVDYKTAGIILIIIAGLLAFIATEVSENRDDFWHTDDGEELADNRSSSEPPSDHSDSGSSGSDHN